MDASAFPIYISGFPLSWHCCNLLGVFGVKCWKSSCKVHWWEGEGKGPKMHIEQATKNISVPLTRLFELDFLSKKSLACGRKISKQYLLIDDTWSKASILRLHVTLSIMSLEKANISKLQWSARFLFVFPGKLIPFKNEKQRFTSTTVYVSLLFVLLVWNVQGFQFTKFRKMRDDNFPNRICHMSTSSSPLISM